MMAMYLVEIEVRSSPGDGLRVVNQRTNALTSSRSSVAIG